MRRRDALKLIPAATCAAVAKAAAASTAYRMPLESGAHARTLMQWPSSEAIHGRRALASLRACVARAAATIARFEPVAVIARPDQHEAARAALVAGVDVWPAPIDDLWCRDSGPTFVRSPSGALAIADLNFNGWGGRQTHAADAALAAAIAQRMGLPLLRADVIGEAGGVETDGDGCLIAHESSWINRNRNRGDRKEIERALSAALGAERVIWAPGLAGKDITDFHIDALARFIRPGVVAIQIARTADPNDPWDAAARQTLAALRDARDAKGRKLEIVVIEPPERLRSKSAHFVASYVNYYVCNGAVVAQQFGDDRADARAHDTLAALYPGREVVMIEADALGEAGGGVHCATQQQPVAGAPPG